MSRLKFLKLIVWVSIAVLAFGTFAPTTAHSQGATNCDFDVSQATALLTQAQAKASSGDTAAALALIKQVQEKLTQIAAQCGEGAATPVVSDVALTQTYTSPDGKLTLKYQRDGSREIVRGQVQVRRIKLSRLRWETVRQHSTRSPPINRQPI